MSFATVKLNQASEKYYLIKIIPRRVINNDLASIGGGQYQATFTYPISKVMANDTVLTKVTTVTNPNEYSYDETTNTLVVYSTPSSSNQIVVYYILFYTGGRHRTISEDPENSSTTLRDWLPRILTNPVSTQSIENIIEGTLSINISSLTVINDQNEFEDYLTDNDSFFEADIKIWLILDEIANIQKIYEGKINKVSLTNSKVIFSLEDSLSSLNNPALFGDDDQYTYWTRNSYANMNYNSNNTPIPFFFGPASRYTTISDSAITTLTTAQMLDQSTLYNAVCTNYSNTVSTTTNREWGIGRTSDGWLAFGFTPSSVDNSGADYTRFTGSSAEVDKFLIGDTFSVTQGGTYYLRAVDVDKANNYVYTTKEAAISTGAVVNSNDCPSVVVTDEATEVYYLLYGRDYTATSSSTTGGNKYLKITMVNNFEANHAGLTALDPNRYKVKYRVRPDTTNHLHGSVVKKLLEDAGLTVNIASITSANSTFGALAAFSIPYFDEEDINNYLKYLQGILKSTFGYIALNNSFEIEYHLFSAPSSTDEVTDIDILKGSYSVELDYRDIVTQIIAYNPHYSSEEALNDTDPPSATETSLRAQYLHGVERTTRFRHLLASISTRLDEIISVRSERRAKYKFDTKAINLDSILGDDILLSRRGILGNSSSKQLKLIYLGKSPRETKIVATDLLDI